MHFRDTVGTNLWRCQLWWNQTGFWCWRWISDHWGFRWKKTPEQKQTQVTLSSHILPDIWITVGHLKYHNTFSNLSLDDEQLHVQVYHFFLVFSFSFLFHMFLNNMTGYFQSTCNDLLFLYTSDSINQIHSIIQFPITAVIASQC